MCVILFGGRIACMTCKHLHTTQWYASHHHVCAERMAKPVRMPSHAGQLRIFLKPVRHGVFVRRDERIGQMAQGLPGIAIEGNLPPFP